jgi:hypothetical protein
VVREIFPEGPDRLVKHSQQQGRRTAGAVLY